MSWEPTVPDLPYPYNKTGSVREEGRGQHNVIRLTSAESGCLSRPMPMTLPAKYPEVLWKLLDPCCRECVGGVTVAPVRMTAHSFPDRKLPAITP